MIYILTIVLYTTSVTLPRSEVPFTTTIVEEYTTRQKCLDAINVTENSVARSPSKSTHILLAQCTEK